MLHPRNWFKGQDTVSLLRFLEERIEMEIPNIDAESKQYFKAMHSTLAAANSFLSCMYQAALFLKPAERDLLLDSGHTCAIASRDCAQRAFAWGITRWKFQPKLHFFGEILHPLEVQQRENRPSINPLAWGTQADEDFVGTVSTFSRMVSIRTVHERTIQRYQVGLAMRW